MRLADLITLLDTWYDPRWAESSDAVGLTCGDPEREVRRILFAVDIVAAVVDEAVEYGADVIVTHHPLLLTPVSSVAATTAKGAVIHRLVSNGIALFTAHTNADVPDDGVNESLAAALGLEDVRLLRPSHDEAPAEAHGRGHGRIGRLPGELSLRELAERVGSALPRTAHGVRVAGDPAQRVGTVAVGAGSGDALLAEVAGSGADAYVTSDLKHHRAVEHLEDGGPALVDVAHWAAEWTWLPVVEAKVRRAVTEAGDTVDTRVSTTVTDPWTFRV
jgi:dinuclear metal center YbgI/SA1388 family protein